MDREEGIAVVAIWADGLGQRSGKEEDKGEEEGEGKKGMHDGGG